MDPPADKALILGNGGAAQAVRHVCSGLGMEVLTVSRQPQGRDMVPYSRLSSIIKDYRLIVNATPLGTWPDTDQAPDLPYSLLDNRHFLFDLVYNPPVTKFMHLGSLRHARTCNGLKMLEGQAEKNWEIWQDPRY